MNLHCHRFIFFILFSGFYAAVSFPIFAEASEGTGSDTSIIKDTERDTFFSLSLELERLNELIKRDNKNADCFYNRGWIYEQMNDSAKAEKDYSTAIEINKGHADALYNRGLIYLKSKRYDLAIKDFSKVIRINPGSIDALCNRGNAYSSKGQTKKALEDFTSAIKILPQDPDLYYNRALIYMALGKKTKAMEDMRKADVMGHARAREYLNKSEKDL
jgi:tetratricopeptide (TPR) repeat protein